MQQDNKEWAFATLSIPKYSKWKVKIAGSLVLVPLEGKEPNAFHRLMQRLILGFKWEKSE
jgi:hypothetical protein